MIDARAAPPSPRPRIDSTCPAQGSDGSCHDRRLIVLGLHAHGAAPAWCLTVGDPRHPASDPDVLVAKLLADRLGLGHEFAQSSAGWMAYDRRKNLATSLCALEHTWLMPLADAMHRQASELYEGTGVEVFARTDLLWDRFIEPWERGDPAAVAERILGMWAAVSEDPLELLAGDMPWRRDGRHIARERLAAVLESYPDHPNPLGAFNFFHKNRRSIAVGPLRHLSDSLRLRSPQLDLDLVRFVSGIPYRRIRDTEPQRAAIRRRFPRHADVPFNKDLTPLPRRPRGPGPHHPRSLAPLRAPLRALAARAPRHPPARAP